MILVTIIFFLYVFQAVSPLYIGLNPGPYHLASALHNLLLANEWLPMTLVVDDSLEAQKIRRAVQMHNMTSSNSSRASLSADLVKVRQCYCHHYLTSLLHLIYKECQGEGGKVGANATATLRRLLPVGCKRSTFYLCLSVLISRHSRSLPRKEMNQCDALGMPNDPECELRRATLASIRSCLFITRARRDDH